MIKKSRLLPGMLHRGFEKSMENRTWMNNIGLIPRICVVEPDINEMVYAQAVESLAQVEIPERAHWIRMIILELARIGIHLMSLGGLGGPTGLYTAMYWAQADRDKILQIFEEITGHRVYHMYIIAGGVRQDLPEGIEEKILTTLADLESRLPEYEDLLFNNGTIQARIVDEILLPEEVVWELGVTGIGMRSATGIAQDVRKVTPYARYDQVEFDVPVANYSDAYTRMQVKYEEVFERIRVFRQCIDKMGEGRVNVRVREGREVKGEGGGGEG